MVETTAIDHETMIYSRIWELLLSRDKFTKMVPPGNRIRYDKVEGLNSVEKENPTDADFHEAILFPSSGESSLYTEGETFQTYSPEGPSQWTEKLGFVYTLMLTSPWVGVHKIDRLCAEARTAIRRGGPRLGLPFLISAKLNWKTLREVRTADESGLSQTVRWVSEVEISVECEVEGATLLGA
jgi:hypothetical protein